MFGEDLGEKVMNFLIDLFANWLQQMLIRANDTITSAIEILNENITDTPSTWNNALFVSLRQLSNVAIVPIGIGIMSIVLCYDLITACIDRNNFKDFDTSLFYRFAIKAWAAVYLINNVFTIVTGLFELGANIANTALTRLLSEANGMGDYVASEEFKATLHEFEFPDLVFAWFLSFLVFVVTLAIIIIVMVVTAGRMIEILMYISAAPIPFATMINKEWNSVGFTYLKSILALALQAFFIVVTLAIYIILFNANITIAEDNILGLTGTLLNWLCYGVICCFMLLKTGSISKSICGAH